MKLKYFIYGFLIIIIMIIIISTVKSREEHITSQNKIATSSAITKNEKRQFDFGIEYLKPAPDDLDKIIKEYSEIGATWTKFNGEEITWNHIEPEPPINGQHNYHWDDVDKAVKMAQNAGFKHLIVVLKSSAEWATERRKSSGLIERLNAAQSLVGTPPTNQENLEYYKDYVRNFVERYDADGKNDMPGLLYPVLDYEVETEAQHKAYWLGTAEEYATVLRAAYGAIKEASPNAKVILAGVTFWDIFDDGPKSEQEINRLVDGLADRYPRFDFRHNFGEDFRLQIDFISKTLKEKNYFDAVEFHLLSYYTSIPGTVKWLRDEMRKNGYEKPIYMGDAGAVYIPSSDKKGFLSAWSTYTLFSKPPYKNGDKLFKILKSKKDKYGLKYKDVDKWFKKEQASILVKSLVMAAGEGIKGSNWWTWKDIPALSLPVITNGVARSWSLGGLIDNDNKTKKPVFYAYKLLLEKIGNFSTVEKISLNSDISSYKFMVEGKPIYVMWYNAKSPRKPNEQERGITINLSGMLTASQTKITRIITESEHVSPVTQTADPKNILLTETPIFME